MSGILRRLASRFGPFVGACALLLAAFQFLIAAAVASVDVPGAVQTLLASLPPFLRSVVESQFFGGLDAGGLVAFGWNHPIAHALGTAVAVLLGAQAIAGEIESGAIELVLAQPLARSRYLAAQALFGAGAVAIVSLAGLAGTIAGARAFALGPFTPASLAKLALAYASLQWAWFGLALLFSSFGREGGRVAAAGVLVALVSYVAFVIGTVWERAAFVLPWSLHHAFAPREILVDGTSVAAPVARLLAFGAVAALVAAWRFSRRDLP